MNICKRLSIFVFAENLGKNVDKNISKNLGGKYCQKILNHAKQSVTEALKTASKIVFQKTAKVIGDLTGNKVAGAVTKYYHGKITKRFKKFTTK